MLLIFHGLQKYYLVGCNKVDSGRSPPTFQRNISPSFSGLKNVPSEKTARNRQFLFGLTPKPGDRGSEMLMCVLDYTVLYSRIQYSS
jgi:hypothetical protein